MAESYIVVYRSPAAVDRGLLGAHGHTITHDLGAAGVMVVNSNNPSDLAALPGVEGIAVDRPRISVPRDEEIHPVSVGPAVLAGCASTGGSCGLQWDLDRIHVPQAWQTTMGSPTVRVAVLDTGLRSTHEEVGPNYDIADSASFVQPNPFCPADASTFMSIEDFNGHGTWTALHVGGINGAFMTGIAPLTTLINVRVLGVCGFGFDSWILNGMMYANQVGAQIISMSLGGYVCADGVVPNSVYCSTPADAAGGPEAWKAYQLVTQFLQSHGTTVIAAAGNEHVRLSISGRVTSGGSLAFSSIGPDPGNDLRGLSELPGGVPGSIAVSAVNRVTAPASAGETLYGQYGVGSRDQLTYYSSYGERIDVSAPGGARNYNVPRFDCLSGNCARLGPSSPSATDNPGDFGVWGACDTCYVDIQGTSMATPQVSGVAALALAAHPGMSASALARSLTKSATAFLNPNATPPIATNPFLPQFNFDVDYSASGISNRLMGSGVIDAALAVQ